MAEKKGLFGKKSEPAPVVDNRFTDIMARIRLNEQRSSELRKKVAFVEQNSLSNFRSLSGKNKNIQEQISELKQELQTMNDTYLKILKELRLCARKEDVDVLRRYLEIWDPVKFVTVDNAERIIDEKLSGFVPIRKEGKSPAIDADEVLKEKKRIQKNIENEIKNNIKKVPKKEVREAEEVNSVKESGSKKLGKSSFESLVNEHSKGNV